MRTPRQTLEVSKLIGRAEGAIDTLSEAITELDGEFTAEEKRSLRTVRAAIYRFRDEPLARIAKSIVEPAPAAT